MSPTNQLLDALPVAVYTTDSQGYIDFYNQAAVELWGGVPAADARWCGSSKLFHPDGRVMAADECPMAIALSEGRSVRGIEAVIERPDGSRIPILPHPSPLRDAAGRITGGVNMLIDLTERDKARIESSLLASIVASSQDAIVSKTLEGQITSWNVGAARIFGYETDEMVGQPIGRIIPPELWDEETQVLARLRRGEQVAHYDTVRIAKDGRRVDISLTVSPLRNAAGTVIGASKVGRDVTERKRTERWQRLMMEELNHRVKNALATVQAIATLSSRRADSLVEFVPGFIGRIQALARAHALLARARMEGADIAELIEEQVKLGGGDDERISAAGPRLMVDPQAAVHLSMVLHELATNARRHGALAMPEGQLGIGWELRTQGERSLVLRWEETGVQTVHAPDGRSFGTMLIDQTLRGHGGYATMRYAAGGVRGEIVMPLPERDPPDPKTITSADDTRAGLAMINDRPQSALAGKQVLIIEDEPLIALDLDLILTTAGAKVHDTAGTVERAKRSIATGDFDVAILDGNLGGDPVDEVAVALTKRGVPFIFVTGYGRESLPQGFRDALVVTKPFTSEQLITAVQRRLDPEGVARLRQRAPAKRMSTLR